MTLGPGKCISVPSSPMHKLTEAQPADNGALRPSTSPKIDVSATTRLKGTHIQNILEKLVKI